MIPTQSPLEQKVKALVRDVPDFPKPGILFKDLSPVLKKPDLCKEIISYLVVQLAPLQPEALVCLESRGFWLGLSLAIELNIPMIPVRKEGKLPYECIGEEYELEYGKAKIEMHIDALEPGSKVLVHDDLLATGGTAAATAKLIQKMGAEVCGFSFLVELDFLKGREVLHTYTPQVFSLIKY